MSSFDVARVINQWTRVAHLNCDGGHRDRSLIAFAKAPLTLASYGIDIRTRQTMILFVVTVPI